MKDRFRRLSSWVGNGKLPRALLPAFGLLVFLFVWELSGWLRPGAAMLLPVPSQLPSAFVDEFRSGIWIACVGQSLSHYVLGLLIGILSGMMLGILTGMNRVVESTLNWIIRALRPIPGLAWVPFAILWFGVEQGAAVFIIAIGVFWIVYFATHAAIRHVDRDLVEVAAAFGFNTNWSLLTKILLPSSLPGVLVGVRTALGQAWMAVVAAELFGVPGLGQRMNQAASLLSTDIVVVYMLTIAGLYGLVDTMFMLVQNLLLSWKN